MDPDDRRLWAVAQLTVALLMAGTIFFTVTGFLWWLALNVAAGVAGIVAAALFGRPAAAMQASTTAAALFAPMNLFFGIMGFFWGSIDAVPFALIAVSVAQILVAMDAIKHAPAQA